MHQILLPYQLAARARALGWSLGHLAEMAGLHRTTFTRAVAGESNITLATLTRLTEALTARELALRDHLVALHGSGAGGQVPDARAPHPALSPQAGRGLQEAAARAPDTRALTPETEAAA
jgi:transcriptional regulator with XRE-family HTH domain